MVYSLHLLQSDTVELFHSVASSDILLRNLVTAIVVARLSH